MSMTREKAIKLLKQYQGYEPMFPDGEKLKLAALRGPTREMVERIAGKWKGAADGYADGELVYDMWSCSECGYTIDTDDPDELPIVCPRCLAPMTDEAVDMILKRMEEMTNEH